MSISNLDKQSKRATQEVARLSARRTYGRLISILASQTGDIAAAEDVLSEALTKALVKWPEEGVPQNPEAWLITVAKNTHKDQLKSADFRLRQGSIHDEDFTEQAIKDDNMSTHNIQTLVDVEKSHIPDERLKLMFACAHPAIDESIHTPLMMQTVLGFEAADIASSYVMPAATLAQRLVRAKRKIKDAAIPFAIPTKETIPARLHSVLEAIYGAYALSWNQDNTDDLIADMAKEALYLASVVADLMPEEPEVMGLMALMLFSLSRREARIDENNVLVPIEDQDPKIWIKDLWQKGQYMLQQAANHGAPQHFQLEALIQSIHMSRIQKQDDEIYLTNWPQIVQIYDALVSLGPTLGALIARASAVGHAFGPEAGLKALEICEELADETELNRLQPYWATKAYLMREKHGLKKAQIYYDKAISLTTYQPTRNWLETQKERDAKA